MKLDNAVALINAIKQGEMIILMDDEGRENEGDLVMGAEFITHAAVNFMITEAKGLLCVALKEKDAARLQLPLSPKKGQTSYGTAFTLSVDARDGITTGISAGDRAKTIQLLADSTTPPKSLVIPGHVFPIIARNGGVLERRGHTEAASSIADWAGLRPAAAIIEIIGGDGEMLRGDDLYAFAKTHSLKIGTIESLVAHAKAHGLH